MRFGGARGRFDFGVAGLDATVSNVVRGAGAKQDRILWYQRVGTAQVGQGERA